MQVTHAPRPHRQGRPQRQGAPEEDRPRPSERRGARAPQADRRSRGAFPARKLSLARDAPGPRARSLPPLRAGPARPARTRTGFGKGSPLGLASRPPRPRRATRRDLAPLQARTLHTPRGRAPGSRAGGRGEPKNARWGWRRGGGPGSHLSCEPGREGEGARADEPGARAPTAGARAGVGKVRLCVGARGRPRPRRRPRSAWSSQCSGKGVRGVGGGERPARAAGSAGLQRGPLRPAGSGATCAGAAGSRKGQHPPAGSRARPGPASRRRR